jgi:hypothetical protein
LGLAGQTPAVAQPPLAAPSHPPPARRAGSLASHRAVYAIKLVRATQRDGVRYASGTTSFLLTDRCRGYTVETSMHLELGMSNGDDSTMDQQYAAWEAKDNRSASFRMLSRENGNLKESYHGTVTLDDKGAGSITYVGLADQPQTVDLPAGTLLSTAHTAAMLKAADKGETFFTRSVVDGTLDEGPYKVAAVIGPEPRRPLKAAGTTPLEAGAARPFVLAYFPMKSDDDQPRYELTMDLYPNGVAKHMVQDFGGFTLAFDLVSVDPVAAPNCP